jgi:hypothetical protein
MSAIGSATSIGVDLVSLLRGSSGGAEATSAGAAVTTKSPSKSASSSSPATIVDLSDRAKAVMERARTDQTAADRLDRALSALKAGDTEKRPLSKEGEAILAKYGDLPGAEKWAAAASADNLGLLEEGLGTLDLRKIEEQQRRLLAGEQLNVGSADMSEDELFVDSAVRGLVNRMIDLENAGRTEEAAALRTAITDGTIKIQKASDVPELNLNYSVEHFADGSQGGTRSSWQWNPTGEAKEAWDAGRAFAFGGGDRGAFWLTW